jgi:hypothetical protein
MTLDEWISKHPPSTWPDLLVAAGTDKCILCQSPKIREVAMFLPNDNMAKLLGQPEGKYRVALYALCGKCMELQDKLDRVEKKMLADNGVSEN